jgi:hypothetical protein
MKMAFLLAIVDGSEVVFFSIASLFLAGMLQMPDTAGRMADPLNQSP